MGCRGGASTRTPAPVLIGVDLDRALASRDPWSSWVLGLTALSGWPYRDCVGLRERAKLGELERNNAQLRERISRLEHDNAALRADRGHAKEALEHENDRLGASLVEARRVIEQLRGALKHAKDTCTGLETELRGTVKGPLEQDRSFATIQTTAGISPTARAHLREIYDAASDDYYFVEDLRKGLAAIVGVAVHCREVPPGTCYELAKALRITHTGFFRWLIKRSPLISVYGRDAKNRVIYSLHIELLTCADLPAVRV